MVGLVLGIPLLAIASLAYVLYLATSIFHGVYFHITGKRVLTSNRTFLIITGIMMTASLFTSLDIRSRFDYGTGEELLILISLIFVALLPVLLAAIFVKEDSYTLMNSNKKEIKIILENLLNEKGIIFIHMNEDNELLLDDGYETKLKYTSSIVDLSNCWDADFKKDLIEYIKTKEKCVPKDKEMLILHTVLGLGALAFLIFMSNFLYSIGIFKG